MFGNGGVASFLGRADMGRNPLVFVTEFDTASSNPGVKLLALELVGHGVVVTLDLDVVVDADADLFPSGKLVGRCG